LNAYFSSRWRDKLIIRQAGASFFEEIQPEQREKISYGIHLHAILSRIHYAHEIPLTLDKLVREGLILEKEKAAIQHQLDKLMLHPVVGPWFSDDWNVRTEVPILLPGGAENRIDRLITRDHQAIVVDFKTGEKSRADQRQVLEEMQILRKMNFTEVEGYLLYTRDLEVMEVHEGKIKLVKKKDESQLGLF
jgi:ATP-dependent helicase/nuclease subunit A